MAIGLHAGRRAFIKKSAICLAAAYGVTRFHEEKHSPQLSFSTLGCPTWNLETIIRAAVDNKYTGIEFRGLRGELDLPKCPEFGAASSRTSTLRLMDDNGLKIVDLGSSVELHHKDLLERGRQLTKGKQFIDLAAQMHCPFIRVFPNILPSGGEKNAAIDLIIAGLKELGQHAKGSHVRVLLESHGDGVHTADLQQIMESSADAKVGMVWDIVNMWTVTKESPAQVYEKLKKYIFHTHIKDARMVNDKPEYTLLGRGVTPIFAAIDILRNGGYQGFYSFEWEKLWHPELPEPEIAIPDYARVINQHFRDHSS